MSLGLQQIDLIMFVGTLSWKDQESYSSSSPAWQSSRASCQMECFNIDESLWFNMSHTRSSRSSSKNMFLKNQNIHEYSTYTWPVSLCHANRRVRAHTRHKSHSNMRTNIWHFWKLTVIFFTAKCFYQIFSSGQIKDWRVGLELILYHQCYSMTSGCLHPSSSSSWIKVI